MRSLEFLVFDDVIMRIDHIKIKVKPKLRNKEKIKISEKTEFEGNGDTDFKGREETKHKLLSGRQRKRELPVS